MKLQAFFRIDFRSGVFYNGASEKESYTKGEAL